MGSYQGSVIASRSWEAYKERMPVPPARVGTWKHVLHQASDDDKLLLLSSAPQSPEIVEPRGHRAIGVVYHPGHEHLGNYVPTVLPRRYDAFLYLDAARALHPLHDVRPRHKAEAPDTYPSGV
jgi:erythromycin esterase-like protein